MKANSYAALMELNHFLRENRFHARYGRHADAEIVVPTENDKTMLFDQVFLVDTPNQDNQPLSGRREVATLLARSLMLLGLTRVGKAFLARHIDHSAMLIFS